MIVRQYRDQIGAACLWLLDTFCVGLVFILAILLRYLSPVFPAAPRLVPWDSLLSYLPVMWVVLGVCLAWFGAYRLPRHWHFAAAFSTMSKAFLVAVPVTTGLVFTLRLGEVFNGLVQTPSRFVVFASWLCLWPLLIISRWLTGKLFATLYRRNILVRRAIILGDGPGAISLQERVQQHPWLGERIIGRVGWKPGKAWLGVPTALAQLVQAQQVEVIWLVVDDETDDIWVPPLLLQTARPQLIWRMLPDHFAQLVNKEFVNLTETERGRCYRRIQHRLTLPTFSIAMIGSRGVPANYGGVERYVEEVGAYLVTCGAEVAIYCHARYVSLRGQYRGMTLRFVPTLPHKHLETILHTILATGHVLLQEETIIHYHALGPSTMAWLPRLLGRKVVVTIQGLDWQRAKWGLLARWYLRLGEWTAIHCPHQAIVVSQTLADYYRTVHGQETVLIPNGFTPPQYRAPQLIQQWQLEKGNYILFVGRLVPEKGCHTLLEAFQKIQTDKHLVIAGRAAHETGYREQLDILTANHPAIHFIGFARDELLAELYSNAYLVVHPSEMEGLSISLLEALSYGNCLLSSDTPENEEATQGLAVTFVTGSVADLAEKLQRLCDDPAEVGRVRGRVQSQYQQMLNWEAVATATARLYTQVISD